MKQIGLLIVVAAAIALMIPHRGAVSMIANNGQVWDEESVIAPFDIPISKSGKEIEAERQQVRHTIRPVFDMDSTVGGAKIAQMADFLSTTDATKAQIDTAVGSLRRVYTSGVISASEADSYSGSVVMVNLGDNRLRPMHVTSLYTPTTAVMAVNRACGIDKELLQNFVATNMTYDELLSAALRGEAMDNVSTTRGVIRAGEVVVARGQVIDAPTRLRLTSLTAQYEQRLTEGSSVYNVFFGRFLIVLILLFINYLYFTKFTAHYFENSMRKMMFVMLLYLIFSGMVALTTHFGFFSPYIVPLPVLAIYLLTFFNMRVAILGNITAALICSLFVRMPFDFFVINFIGGMVAIFMMRHFYHRGNLMRSIGAIFASQIVLYTCFVLLSEGSFAAVGFGPVIWFLVSGFLAMGFYQAIYLFERLFGFVSDVTLLELCDTNQPLLMQLAQNAPGTFQHSVQVANLAESAAKDIGANPLLARTGALYHDIGKMERPFYFVENTTGKFNPHDDCTAAQSVQILKYHITDGVTIARRNKLPAGVVDFIESHHGTSLIYYFWSKACEQSGEKIAESDFRYQGPRPVGREVSICMMADAVEAASRSLPSYDKEPLEALVDSVIDIQIRDGQFDNSALSFQEIARIKELFKAKLNNIYHGRIAYPVRN